MWMRKAKTFCAWAVPKKPLCDLVTSPLCAVLRAVFDSGYETPSPIQAQAIPAVLEGNDVLGCAQTGTGKTRVCGAAHPAQPFCE